MEKIEISPFRIIPCDLGHQINGKIFTEIYKYIEKSSDFIEIKKLGDINENELITTRILTPNDETKLFLHIYADGVAIFTLIDKKEIYNLDEYEAENTLNIRKKCHGEILTFNHLLSNLIDKHIINLRNFFDENEKRFTASSNWENKGLSYVMSFYFINCNVKLLEEESFQEKFLLLLFPYLSGYDYDLEYSSISDECELIKKKLKNNFIDVFKEDYEIFPNIHTCASWSNFLIIGEISEKIIGDYLKLERDLQHVWFYTYITDKFIEKSLKDISTDVPEKHLEKLDDILTDMLFKINTYEGIVNSTLHERDFRLYNALRTSSRLDMLVASLEKKARLLKDRFNWILIEKRTKTDKKIEFILFIIAIVSIIGSWEELAKLGVKFLVICAIFIIIIAFYFYKPFLNRKI